MRFLYKCIEGGAQPIVYKQKKEVCAVHDYIRICIRVNPISLAGFHLNICGFVYMRVMSRQLLCLYECIGREWGGAANRLQAEERGTYLSPLSIYILVICVYMRVLYACNSCFFLSVAGGGGVQFMTIRICIRGNPISVAVSNLYRCGCVYMRKDVYCNCCFCRSISRGGGAPSTSRRRLCATIHLYPLPIYAPVYVYICVCRVYVIVVAL